MKNPIIKGMGFGLTSGIITTLGLIIGLSSSTNSKSLIIGAVLIIAIADGLSDSFGIHISEEASNKNSKDVWNSTLWTFISKFIVTTSFIIPLILLTLNKAIIISIIWGLLLTTIFSYYLAKRNKDSKIKVILEHILITVVVIILSHFIGKWVGVITANIV